MKRFLAFVLIAALGVVHHRLRQYQKGTTQNKTQTTTTETKDGKTVGETTTTNETKTKATTPAGWRHDDRKDDREDLPRRPSSFSVTGLQHTPKCCLILLRGSRATRRG